jgi:hypothetical protein
MGFNSRVTVRRVSPSSGSTNGSWQLCSEKYIIGHGSTYRQRLAHQLEVIVVVVVLDAGLEF